MKLLVGTLAVLGMAPTALAADADAGRAKVQVVCAACHGATGISVSDAIPNLAGQRAGYIEAQLRALKDGSRKNAIMNAIAGQLSTDDMANVAAYFSQQTIATAGVRSDFLPNVAKTNVTFPENYKTTYTQYHTINFPATKQVRYYFANPVALKAAREGKSLPDGSVLFAEVWSAKLDADGKPVTGDKGFFVANELVGYTAMARDANWGRDIPDMLRNENWNYAVYTAAKQPRPGINQAECLACHKPLDQASYTFTLDQLKTAAK
jgi:cytochrome c553